ncbi:hypothetical protein [Methanothermococcus okinawensis]|uniref:Uncharacterized protein n=1 Tax=Methanothermococcus okinawensis (strain DSM 14208 / JCM 11175 / IH1) TaxID=647113 RepID=F8AJW9_METOI|nr:hypothetical protein [Methanothermococcus okinawensis]AEH07325.1 hypothetical protein Metok_1360 [Methanothermococcus okinawensis IH1]
MKLYYKKGQISIDAVLAIMFLLLISTLIYYNVFNTSKSFKNAELADRLYSIADSFENYALLSYSKNVTISMELKPIGLKSYTLYFGNKSIVVDTTRTIFFIPTDKGVNITGDILSSSGKNLNKTINITYDNSRYYILKNTSIQIQ